jgi:hypothetical protein
MESRECPSAADGTAERLAEKVANFKGSGLKPKLLGTDSLARAEARTPSTEVEVSHSHFSRSL